MNSFCIILGLLVSSFSIPTRAKMRHFPSRNDRNTEEKGEKMNAELAKRNWDEAYQRHISLPACNTIKKSGNTILNCNTYSAYGDKVMKCEASCPKNYEFANGSNRKEVSCIKRYDDDSRHLIQILSCMQKKHAEFVRPDKVKERLPACHQIRKPANSYQTCKRRPGSSYEDPAIQCQVWCDRHYVFPDGSTGRTIACTLENKKDDWRIVVKIPRCMPKGTELLEKSKNTERKMSLPGCSSLKPPANGLITCTIDYSYQDNLMDCVPSCKQNYEFADGSDGRSITCTREDQDGAWSKYLQIPNCESKMH